VFQLSKIAPAPFYPLGLSIILGAAAVWFLVKGRKKAGTILAAVACGGLLFFSLPVTEFIMIRPLESRYNPPAAFSKCSAVVLLGGGEVAALPPRRYPETNDFGDRILHAARIYRMGVAPYLVISGGCAGESARLLSELFGIDPSVILRETAARNTAGHGNDIEAALASRGLPPNVIVVTSAMHMYRSVKVLRKAGFTVQPAPTDYRADIPYRWALTSFLPRAASLANSTEALHEYYGLMIYWISGRI
jgi:uncharacterized SAM-binding protein YcdF (DUF218 family)